MCVIIHRKRDITIPSEKIDTACTINKDGFGLSFIQDERLETIRSIEKNDPKTVADLLQKYRDRDVFLHLRHATVGSVCMDNNHPLNVATKDADGFDVQFMHNGTLTDWKAEDKTVSDTALFNSWVLSPLVKRTIPVVGKETLDDFLLKEILNKLAGWSIFLLYDSLGNVLKVNGDRGKEYDGYWASNEYSFRQTHDRYRSSVPYVHRKWDEDNQFQLPPGVSRTQKASQETLPWQEEPPEVNARLGIFDHLQDDNFSDKEDDTSLLYQMGAVRTLIKNSKETKDSIMVNQALHKDLFVKRVPFLGEAGAGKLEDICRLSRSQLEEACDQYPKGMAQILIDLIALQFPNVYGQNKEVKLPKTPKETVVELSQGG